MKSYLFLLIISFLTSCSNSKTIIESIIKDAERVANYELANPSKHDEDLAYDYINGWIPSTFYVSLIPLYEVSQNKKYLDAVKNWGNKSKWTCAPRFRHADDLVCGQVYLDLYKLDNKQIYIKSLQTRMDSLIATAIPGKEDWSWCDALFMAPPVYMMAGEILDDKKYQEYADVMYWDVYDYLFDKDESFFYRDERFFNQKSPNGKKLFWGRGNGWVLGGLARMIPYIKNEKMKERYIDLFKVMSKKIIQLQQKDGLWRSNLLDVEHMPQKETSSTGFFIYALAWGINNGYLDKGTYASTVLKGWKGLIDCIDQETGMIGWVQPIGAAPGDTTAKTTMSYGAGAFILAAAEMVKYYDNK